MSLILDALRKSEAQRQRSGTPGLHTPASRHLQRRPRWAFAGTVAALTLVGSGAWWWTRPASSPVAHRDAEGEQAPQAATTEAALAMAQADGTPADAGAESGGLSRADALSRESAPFQPTAAWGGKDGTLRGSGGSGGGEWPDPQLNLPATAMAQPGSGPMVNLPPAVSPPPPQLTPPPAMPVAPEIDAQAVAAAAQAQHAAAAQRVDGLAASAPQSMVGSATPVAPGAELEVPPPPAIPTIHDLDFGVRRDLPKMSLSMLVYAKDPARRFALINGKRYVAGGEAIDGRVIIVDVLPDGLLCEFNGQRFLLPRE